MVQSVPTLPSAAGEPAALTATPTVMDAIVNAPTAAPTAAPTLTLAEPPETAVDPPAEMQLTATAPAAETLLVNAPSAAEPPDIASHREAFGEAIKSLIKKNSTLMTHDKRSLIIDCIIARKNGESLYKLKKLCSTIDSFEKKCDVLQLQGQAPRLVEKPKVPEGGSGLPSIESMRVYSCVEEVFDVIRGHHASDHAKGRSLYERIDRNYKNIPRDFCKVFTDTCPICLETMITKKPTAGHQPIVTRGFNKRGQIDLVDFQSMPDGDFKYLCNYIDHGIKFAFSIPIVAKRPATIAFALVQIFTIIGPPLILQSDNGREFIGQAGGKHLVLEEEVSLFIHSSCPTKCKCNTNSSSQHII